MLLSSSIIELLTVMVPLLLSVAFLTLAERKAMGSMILAGIIKFYACLGFALLNNFLSLLLYLSCQGHVILFL